MPVVRQPMSISQFSELIGIEPKRFVGVEVNRRASTVVIVLEPEADSESDIKRDTATQSGR